MKSEMELIEIATNIENKEIEENQHNEKQKMIEKEECAICFDSYTIEDRVIFDCNHSVCIPCYEKLIQSNPSCPFCRTQIDTTTVRNDTIVEIDTTRESEWQQQCRIIRQYLFISFLLVLVIVYYLYIKK